jgi:hypothetical protein
MVYYVDRLWEGTMVIDTLEDLQLWISLQERKSDACKTCLDEARHVYETASAPEVINAYIFFDTACEH